ncbi:MAG: hypothetical protein ABIX28_18930 [Vicinamibacterales bacterium]
MSHLSSEELVDHLDGGLPPARAAHLETCRACRTEAEELTGVLARTAPAREVPEPSPLFWAHFSARVRNGLAGSAAPTWKELVWWPGSAWAAGVASVVLVLLVSQSMVHSPATPTLTLLPRGSATAYLSESDPADDLEADQAWAVVRTVADGADDDAAHEAGIATRPDAAERMTQELSSREKSALADLLASELKRSGN